MGYFCKNLKYFREIGIHVHTCDIQIEGRQEGREDHANMEETDGERLL